MAGISAINDRLTGQGNNAALITVYQSKYLNNIVEQDHGFIKKIMGPMLGLKNFASAEGMLTEQVAPYHQQRAARSAGSHCL